MKLLKRAKLTYTIMVMLFGLLAFGVYFEAGWLTALAFALLAGWIIVLYHAFVKMTESLLKLANILEKPDSLLDRRCG